MQGKPKNLKFSQRGICRRGILDRGHSQTMHNPEQGLPVPCEVVGADGGPTIAGKERLASYHRDALINVLMMRATGSASRGRLAPRRSLLREAPNRHARARQLVFEAGILVKDDQDLSNAPPLKYE